MKNIPIHSSEIQKIILLDIMHNQGTTKGQVQYRVHYSSILVERAIEQLASQKFVIFLGNSGKMLASEEGINSVIGARIPSLY
jgi:hypothetical protein